MGIFVGILLILFSFSPIIAICIIEHNSYYNEFEPISFKMFESLYYTAPDKWDLDVFHPIYKNNVIFFKTIPDGVKYFFFRRNVKKQEKDTERIKNTAKLLKMWQKDIDKCNE
jgi:hypothetical protein